MNFLLAHAGESHETTVEAVAHTATPWYIAVPLFILAVLAVTYLTWVLSKKKIDIVIFVISPLLLIAGFTMFNFSSAISIISLAIGFILSGILAFGGISAPKSKKSKK
jgi:predicted membrane protein